MITTLRTFFIILIAPLIIPLISHTSVGDLTETRFPFPFYDAKVSVEPPVVLEGESIKILVEGSLPSTAYGLEHPSPDSFFTDATQIAVLSTDPPIGLKRIEGGKAQIVIPLWVKEIAEVGAEVLVPVQQKFEVDSLFEGTYEVLVTINGEKWAVTELLVRSANPPDPEDRPSQPVTPISHFNATIQTEPARPLANQFFKIIFEGEFPDPDSIITNSSIHILESFPEQIAVDIEIGNQVRPAGEDTIDGATRSIEHLVGVLKLGAGNHPLRGFINGELFYDGVVEITGKEPFADSMPFLIFDRSGGFAGLEQRLIIDGNGHFQWEGNPPFNMNPPFGSVQRGLYESIVDQVFAVDFPNLEKQYPSEVPLADGFFFRIHHNGILVEIEQEAKLPDELAALLRSLETLIEGNFLIPFESPSSVNLWEMY